MAIKITTQIGTDLGITSEAYLRIVNYNIQKGGYANFQTQLFLDAEAATSGSNLYPGMGGMTARNQQIGESLYVDLRVPSESVVFRTMNIPSQSIDESGSISYTTVETTVSESVTVMVPDFTAVEEANIFEFGYAKLKEKVIEVFGTGSYEDC